MTPLNLLGQTFALALQCRCTTDPLPSPQSDELAAIIHSFGGQLTKRLGYAVVDLESTGLDPWQDRVISIAVIHLDLNLDFERDWYTLVNPHRAIPQTVSGLTKIVASDVQDAPSFASIIPTVSAALKNRILVAHNVSFDSCLLLAEYRRAGHVLPTVPSICTLHLSQEQGFKQHSLITICKELGISNPTPHNARSDAQATTSLLRHLYR